MRANIKTQPSFFNPLSETGRLQAQMCRWRGVGLAREARLSPRPGGGAVPSRPRPRARLPARRRGSGWPRPSRIIKISRLADNTARFLPSRRAPSFVISLATAVLGWLQQAVQRQAQASEVSVRSCGRKVPLPFVTAEGESMRRLPRPHIPHRVRPPSSEHRSSPGRVCVDVLIFTEDLQGQD